MYLLKEIFISPVELGPLWTREGSLHSQNNGAYILMNLSKIINEEVPMKVFLADTVWLSNGHFHALLVPVEPCCNSLL